MKKSYYIYNLSNVISEGGMSRNSAFYNRMCDFDCEKINAYHNSILMRLIYSLKIILLLFVLRNRKIVIHQQTLWILFPVLFMKKIYIRELVFQLLAKVSLNNKLIIEINDLIYEQSIDLQLNVNESFVILQDKLYTIKNCNYIFASNEMERYVLNKYSLNPAFSSVIVNGGPELTDCSGKFVKQDWLSSTKLKYVYAGSLNKGRQIEELIKIFNGDQNTLLIILGNEGDWLKDIPLSDNVIYLGNFREEIAHFIVSKCDIGLIPYNQNRFYYNLCFPTKVSFYLTAGIPVLSTPLLEIQNVFLGKGVILFKPIAEWREYFKSISNEKIIEMKRSVFLIEGMYNWKYLLKAFNF